MVNDVLLPSAACATRLCSRCCKRSTPLKPAQFPTAEQKMV